MAESGSLLLPSPGIWPWLVFCSESKGTGKRGAVRAVREAALDLTGRGNGPGDKND